MNISVQEMTALLELAGRAPMSSAERLWHLDIVTRWNNAQPALAQPAPAPPKEAVREGAD